MKHQFHHFRTITSAAIAFALYLLPLAMLTPVSAAEPTLQETVTWLKETLIQNGAHSTKNYKVEAQYMDVRLEGKTLIIVYENSHGAGSDRPYTYVYSIYYPLSQLKPTVKVTEGTNEYSAPWNAHIECSGGEKKIRLKSYRKEKEERREELYSGWVVQLDNKELTERVAKALSHAIKLCGGKDTPSGPF